MQKSRGFFVFAHYPHIVVTLKLGSSPLLKVEKVPHSIVMMLCSVGSVSDLKTTISSLPNNNVTYSSCVIFVINPFLKTVRGIN